MEEGDADGMFASSGGGMEDQGALLQNIDGQAAPTCKEVSAKTTTRIIKRIKAMTLKLLPIEVDSDELKDPLSSIITKEVVEAYGKCGGDFEDAVPYCLLEARRSFYQDALNDPSDYDENLGRKVACEVIARRLVIGIEAHKQHVVLSKRYTRIESDGDESLPTSCLESAVDQHCPFFMSSNAAQRVIFALWDGHLVQEIDSKGHTVYALYKNAAKGGFLNHLSFTRLAVPRYQNWLRIALWVLFAVAYAVAVQTPDREWGVEDWILYVQLFGYLAEDITKVYKVGYKAGLTVWTIVNMCIWAILLVAFGYRMADVGTQDEKKADHYRTLSFHILSCAAPLIWMKFLPIFDQLTYFGTLQIVVYRMMRESAIFFTLLALLAIGFVQSLTGLDASDSNPRDSTTEVIYSLFESLLGSPNFDMFRGEEATIVWPFGLILYYSWSFLTIVILLNVLVALFGSAYQQITDDAISEFLAFFGQKVVSAVRAPDEFVYVAPFNLVEMLILPAELVISKEKYTKLNAFILTILFSPALCLIALFESRIDRFKVKMAANALLEDDEEYDEDPEASDEDQKQGQLSKTKFEDLVKDFPDLSASPISAVLRELKKLQKQVETLEAKLDEKKEGRQ